jgi:hypothetical protein
MAAKLFNNQSSLDLFIGNLQFDANIKLYNSESFDTEIGMSQAIRTHLSQNMCNYIDDAYVRDKISDALSNNANVDIIFLINELNKKTDKIIGFLISVKGECARLQDTHSISLICTTKVPGSGTILLGAYLYSIKQIGQEYGILDLAKGFVNISAYCAYQKFGFNYVPALDLYNNCYPVEDGLYDNLPMVVSIASLSYDDIYNIIKGSKKLPKNPLCNVKDNQNVHAFIEKVKFVDYITNDKTMTREYIVNKPKITGDERYEAAYNLLRPPNSNNDYIDEINKNADLMRNFVKVLPVYDMVETKITPPPKAKTKKQHRRLSQRGEQEKKALGKKSRKMKKSKSNKMKRIKRKTRKY